MNCYYCKNATGMCDMCRPQRSNTAMTMPESEYIEHQCTMQCGPSCNVDGASYIRSDIAEELARALELAISGQMQNSPDTWAHAEEALARYHSINSTTPQ